VGAAKSELPGLALPWEAGANSGKRCYFTNCLRRLAATPFSDDKGAIWIHAKARAASLKDTASPMYVFLYLNVNRFPNRQTQRQWIPNELHEPMPLAARHYFAELIADELPWQQKLNGTIF
jgi:hypothetical protein